jgi:hypothetical protein
MRLQEPQHHCLGCRPIFARVRIEKLEMKMSIATPCIKEKPAPAEYSWRKEPLPVGKDAADTLKIKVGILLKDAELAKARNEAWEAATLGCVVPPPVK